MKNNSNTKNSIHLVHYSDLGNAYRYVQLFNGRYIYIVEAKQWYVWNGKRWEADNTKSVIRNFTKVLDDIEGDTVLLDEALQNGQITEQQCSTLLRDNAKWHKISQSAGKIHAAIDLARSQERS